MRFPLIVSAIAVCACTGSGSLDNLSRQVAQAEALNRQQAGAIRAMMLNVGEIVGGFDSVEAQYRAATANYELARRMASEASAAYADAEAKFKAAGVAYQQMLALVLIAATWDMSTSVCEGIQSTASYRREFGVKRGMCVDHVFPHAAGGVNQAWNYMVIDCSLNSALGDAVWSKLMAEPIPMLQGMAVSALARLRCGADPRAWKR
jgi:hypothetical protein